MKILPVFIIFAQSRTQEIMFVNNEIRYKNLITRLHIIRNRYLKVLEYRKFSKFSFTYIYFSYITYFLMRLILSYFFVRFILFLFLCASIFVHFCNFEFFRSLCTLFFRCLNLLQKFVFYTCFCLHFAYCIALLHGIYLEARNLFALIRTFSCFLFWSFVIVYCLLRTRFTA